MSQQVVRRFEVHAATLKDLAPARTAVQKAARPGLLTILDLEEVERPPSLEIRLKGELGAVATVVEDIRRNYQVLQDFVDVPNDTVSDRMFPDPWALLRMTVEPRRTGSAPEHFPGGGSPPVKVAIVDSGIMAKHVDLKSYIQTDPVGGTRSTTDATDEDGHGTMLAGTILATAELSRAIQLVPVKFFDPNTSPSAEKAWRAIDLALTEEPKPRIILLSWELGSDSDEVRKAIQRACNAGVLVVFAAGNHGSNNDEVPAYPSRYAWDWPEHVAREMRARTLTVMATDQYDEKAWFSSYGSDSVDLAAPGVEIISTRPYVSKAAESPEGQALRYCRYHGTSAASAHVAGAAALIMSRYPGLSAEQVKNIILDSVAKRPGLKCRSEGRLDLAQALTHAAKVAASVAPVPSVSSGSP